MQPILDGGRLERRGTLDRGEKYTHRCTEKYTRKYKGKYNIQKLRKQTSGFLINCEYQNRCLLILSDVEIKNSHILPTGQWYAPSAVINDALIMH